ncbi:hypothetical protein YC2023_000848 [Brassica napus]
MDRSSKEEDDSELKTMLECVNVAFTTWLHSRELVTLYCDVNTQSAPQNIIETKSAASSGSEQTATQDNKTEIVDKMVLFSKEKEVNVDEGDPDKLFA